MKEQKGFAITSMVLGIVSLAITVFCCGWSYFYVPGSAAIVGLILGIISLVQHRAGRGMAISGVVMCSVTIVLLIIAIILIYIFANGNFENPLDPWLGGSVEPYKRSDDYIPERYYSV